MVRRFTLPLVRIAFGLALPMISSWAMADDFESDLDSPAPAIELNDDDSMADDQAAADSESGEEDSSLATSSDDEPGVLSDAMQEPTLAPVGENADSESALDSEKSSDTDSTQTEIIRERYASTAIKIERHVGQDDEGNYYNHGLYTHFDEKGRVIGTGDYREGKRQGKWQRWFAPNEGPMFTGPMFKEFQGPFASEVTYLDDQLHGVWRVFDGKGRKASEWEFCRRQAARQEHLVLPHRQGPPRDRLQRRRDRRRSDRVVVGQQSHAARQIHQSAAGCRSRPTGTPRVRSGPKAGRSSHAISPSRTTTGGTA